MKRLEQLLSKYPVPFVFICLALVALVVFGIAHFITKPIAPAITPPQAAIEHDKAQQDKGAADELRKQITDKEKEIESLKSQNTQLEQELQKAHQATEVARKSYESTRHATPRHTPVDSSTSTDSLCSRAAKLNIKC